MRLAMLTSDLKVTIHGSFQQEEFGSVLSAQMEFSKMNTCGTATKVNGRSAEMISNTTGVKWSMMTTIGEMMMT